MKTTKLALIGFGNVGRGLAQVLSMKKAELAKRGTNLSIVAICGRDGSVKGEIAPDAALKLKKISESKLFVKKTFTELVDDIGADIMVEMTPTNVKDGEPGMSNITSALNSGMHVVTSNKGPLALSFNELMALAKKKDRQLRFEAAVCAGMPVFNMLENCLQLNEVTAIRGVLNGTTNFILTKMQDEGVSFDVALNQAREMGIAEADASYDVDGIDTAAKLAILGSAIFGTNKRFKDVARVGISEITPEAVAMAKRKGFAIKLVGEVDRERAKVSPRLVRFPNPLNVKGTMNAIQLETDLAKEVTVIGRGAGPIETASAVVSDILNIAEVGYGRSD